MEPFIGMIVQFGGNFAPRNWALCDGALLSISQNQALFSILGTTYGGDGRTTFKLPDLRGRVAIHPGSGPGLSTYSLGQVGGSEEVTLTVHQMPSHNHTALINATEEDADTNEANGHILCNSVGSTMYYNGDPESNVALRSNSVTVGSTGGGSGHPNIQPFQCINFIIALVGTYPSRN